MKLRKATVSEFDGIYREMQKNFIPEEIRDYESAREVMKEDGYSLYHVLCDDIRVGFITVWELSEFAFVEHFVIYADFRNKGLGERTLALLKDKYDKILLEAEPPENEIKSRRISFYKRCAFHENIYEYFQPPYRKGDCGTRLVLLSYPNVLSDFESAKKQIYKDVYKIY
ncbi:MAG: GNAT family N-acetyltransferase [Ruminococcaceae bacterium]|nr:GNAT family N-acetyltransferase [Oscillospiraceae bacterium]